MNTFEQFVAIAGGALILGFVVGSVYLWVRAEVDERRWQRKLKEERDAALIREARYGSSKGKRL